MGAEWFKPSDELLAEIEKCRQESKQLDGYQSVIGTPIKR
jgi:hypothetical protein